MATIKLTETNGKLKVTSPYDTKFVGQAKPIGGRWNEKTRTWDFDVRDRERVEALLGDIYGWVAPEQAGGEVVTARTDLGQWQSEERAFAFGRVIAEKPGRDSLRLGAGVVVVEGTLRQSGGSRNNPRIGNSGVIVEVRDVPVGALDLAREQGVEFEIVDGSAAVDETALRQEREALLARIAEINALLGEE